jgi:hypothetical protein
LNLAKEEILRCIKTGDVLVTINNHRYIKKDNLLFPCVKISNGLYKVKTVLKWEMAEKRINKIIQIYKKTS